MKISYGVCLLMSSWLGNDVVAFTPMKNAVMTTSSKSSRITLNAESSTRRDVLVQSLLVVTAAGGVPMPAVAASYAQEASDKE